MRLHYIVLLALAIFTRAVRSESPAAGNDMVGGRFLRAATTKDDQEERWSPGNIVQRLKTKLADEKGVPVKDLQAYRKKELEKEFAEFIKRGTSLKKVRQHYMRGPPS